MVQEQKLLRPTKDTELCRAMNANDLNGNLYKQRSSSPSQLRVKIEQIEEFN